VSPGLRWSYVLDKMTGRYEKCQVTAEQTDSRSAKKSSKQPKVKEFSASPSPHFKDHRVLPAQTGSAGRSGHSQAQRKRVERQPSYVCPDIQQGKETTKGLPELLHYARECPVS
jgi:hypothetical protein